MTVMQPIRESLTHLLLKRPADGVAPVVALLTEIGEIAGRGVVGVEETSDA